MVYVTDFLPIVLVNIYSNLTLQVFIFLKTYV